MAREIVTSENREEFMEKKLMKNRAKKMGDEQYERARKHPKFEMLKMKLGKKGAMDAVLKEMNDAQKAMPVKEEM
jgi:hypothetical protein